MQTIIHILFSLIYRMLSIKSMDYKMGENAIKGEF